MEFEVLWLRLSRLIMLQENKGNASSDGWEGLSVAMTPEAFLICFVHENLHIFAALS